MPGVLSAFRPPFLLRNGHLQTILPVIFTRRTRVAFDRHRLELSDGDFLDLDQTASRFDRLAILTHGLEGDSSAGYILGMAGALCAAGWDVLTWTFRSCGAEPNRLLRFYHSGETSDLAAVITHGAETHSKIALIGFSLGGNVTLKYLGEAPPPPSIVAGVAISTPVDLASSARSLDRRRSNRIYLRRFMRTLVGKIEAKALRFPDVLDARGARSLRTLEAFDDRYTAPLHGFRDASDYWQRSSSRQFLSKIRVPTLLLNARNDPFLTDACFPEPEAVANPNLFLETPASGGHVGFVDLKDGLNPYSERRTVQFLENPGSTPAINFAS